MIEESLRLEAPAIAMSRVARHDAVLAGQPIGAGERVALVISSANRDPMVFDRPDEFLCRREDNPHVSFGYGIHRCIGDHLARLEMRVVAEEVLRLMPNYRLADGFQPQWLEGRITRGLASLQVLTRDS